MSGEDARMSWEEYLRLRQELLERQEQERSALFYRHSDESESLTRRYMDNAERPLDAHQ